MSTEPMTGHRAWPADNNAALLEPGQFMLHEESGAWYAMTPTGLLANLANHQVELHPDHSITVSPSILVRRGAGEEWHGYLERGAWRQV